MGGGKGKNRQARATNETRSRRSALVGSLEANSRGGRMNPSMSVIDPRGGKEREEERPAMKT